MVPNKSILAERPQKTGSTLDSLYFWTDLFPTHLAYELWDMLQGAMVQYNTLAMQPRSSLAKTSHSSLTEALTELLVSSQAQVQCWWRA